MAFGNTKKLCNFFEIYLDRLIYTMYILCDKHNKNSQTYFKTGTIFKKIKIT